MSEFIGNTAYELEVEILNLTEENFRRKDILKTAKRAYEASKKLRKELAEIEPIDDLHREQIYKAVQNVDEIQDELKLKLEENEVKFEQNKALIKKYERAIKALQ